MSARRSIQHRVSAAAVALAVTVGGIVVGAQPAMAGDVGKASAKTVRVPILLSISGDRTSIERIGTSDSFRMRMQGTHNLVTWFTDRPVRRAGVMEARDLVKEWKGLGFDAVPPNSALVLRAGDVSTTIVVETTHPRYENGVIAFTLKPIPGGGAVIPESAPDADLFIDDAQVDIPVDPGQMPVVHLTTGVTDPVLPTTPVAPTATPAIPAAPAAPSGAQQAAPLVDLNALDFTFHPIVIGDINANYLGKTKLTSEQITQQDSLVFSIPAVSLVSNFSDHHLAQAGQKMPAVPHFLPAT